MKLNKKGEPKPDIANPEAQQVISSGDIWSNLAVNRVSNWTNSLGNLFDISEYAYRTLSKSNVDTLSFNLSLRSASSASKKLFVPACT